MKEEGKFEESDHKIITTQGTKYIAQPMHYSYPVHLSMLSHSPFLHSHTQKLIQKNANDLNPNFISRAQYQTNACRSLYVIQKPSAQSKQANHAMHSLYNAMQSHPFLHIPTSEYSSSYLCGGQAPPLKVLPSLLPYPLDPQFA